MCDGLVVLGCDSCVINCVFGDKVLDANLAGCF